MRREALGFVFAGMMMLTGCGKRAAPTASTQTATVNLKDGTDFNGIVTKSDNSAITLQGANGVARTYPMSQVDSVKYVETGPITPTTTTNVPDGKRSPVPYTIIPAGARVSVRNSDSIRSDRAVAGQVFPAVMTADVIGSDGSVAIPKGSDATLVIRSARKQGKVKGQSEIALDLDSVTVRGRQYILETAEIRELGKQGLGKNRRSAKFIGGGVVLGTVIGAVAGGGAGAAIGAAAGGGAGIAAQTLTRGKSVRIPSESVLSFRLEEAVEIRPLE